jgi:beta-lactamase regulating signal transducer with metallopeptidase domain
VQSTVNRPPRRTVSFSDPLAQSVSLVVLIACTVGALASYLHLRRRRASELVAIRARVLLGPTRAIGGIPVRVSCADIPSPLALRGGEVCVPLRGFFELGAEEQESVLLHEASHVERADAAWLELAHVIRGLLWWQPLGAAVMRALLADTELAADDRALSLGASPFGLVRALMHLSDNLSTGTTVGAAFVAGESPLLKRSHHILGYDQAAPRYIVRALAVSTLIAAGMMLRLLPLPATSRGIPRGCQASPPRGCVFVRAADVRTSGDPKR